MEKQERKYADLKNQIAKVNSLALTVFSIFAFCNFLIVLVSYLRGYQSIGFTALIALISVGGIGAMFLMKVRVPHSANMRWALFAVISILTFIMTNAFDSYYIRFGVVVPLAVCILYYDRKFIMVSAFVTGIIEVITTVMKFFDPECIVDLIDISTATMVTIFFLVVICLVEKIGKFFNHDMLDSIEEEKQHQEGVMQDVIFVANKVRQEANEAMGLMKELNESTNVVTGAVRDISSSTQSTAEHIQDQTVMTQNIQNAIEKTIVSSENMVEGARKAQELNNENLDIVREIQNQSKRISDTNNNVFVVMKELVERAEAVKGVADTIFSISSQTNLLALNASIESARAGEAGRGFAVVADQVRQLAEMTRKETENISAILEELSINAQKAVEVVEESAEATNQQDALIGKAVDTFEAMNSEVSSLTQNISEIDQMLSNLSDANNKIVDNIVHLSATTEEVTASSTQAEEMTNRNLQNADQTKEILDQVLTVAKQLDKYME